MRFSWRWPCPRSPCSEKMYVRKDCNAYQEPDKHSRVTMELHVGHDLTVTDYIDGFYECRYGWVQAKYLSDTCPHKWGSWHTIKEPTCTQKGTREHTCKYCGMAVGRASRRPATTGASGR